MAQLPKYYKSEKENKEWPETEADFILGGLEATIRRNARLTEQMIGYLSQRFRFKDALPVNKKEDSKLMEAIYNFSF